MKDMLKNNVYLLIGIALGLSLIIATSILGNAYKYKYRSQEQISVKGLGSQDFSSDMIVWSASFKRSGSNLQEASAQLSEDKKKVEQFLVSRGITKDSYVFTAVDSYEDIDSYYNQNTSEYERKFNGYTLSQTVKVESKDLEKVEMVSREITDLISDGINLNSESPDYYYSKLEDLKLQLVSDATSNARKRAENVAENANARLGNLKKASMGIFQITGQNDNEEYTYGGVFNTKSKDKTAQVTVNLEFEIK